MASTHVNWWTRARVRRALEDWPRLTGDADSKATAQANLDDRHRHNLPGDWRDLAAQVADLELAAELLPDRQREVLLRCVRDGMTCGEAAGAMGTSRRAVRYLLACARRGIERTLVSRN